MLCAIVAKGRVRNQREGAGKRAPWVGRRAALAVSAAQCLGRAAAADEARSRRRRARVFPPLDNMCDNFPTMASQSRATFNSAQLTASETRWSGRNRRRSDRLWKGPPKCNAQNGGSNRAPTANKFGKHKPRIDFGKYSSGPALLA